MKTKAGKLRDEADSLADRVAVTASRLATLENQVSRQKKKEF